MGVNAMEEGKSNACLFKLQSNGDSMQGKRSGTYGQRYDRPGEIPVHSKEKISAF